MRSVTLKSGMAGLALVSLLLVEGAVAAADAPPGLEQRLAKKGKTLLSLADGESATLYGKAYHAQGATRGLVVLSSEFVSVAVLQGKLDAATGTATQTAEPGEVLVTPIEGRKTERFFFDAAVLARSLPPELGAETLPLLNQIAAQQKRQRFFGLIEPVGINASAPAPGPVEAMRLTYLSDPAIIDIRQRAGGDIEKRGRMTAERFASALAAGDAETLASLIDPKPFTDVTLDAARWRSARLSFAQKLTANAPLVAALAQTRVSDAPNAAPGAKSFLLEREGASVFRITIVDRDRASFVATLEPAS